MFGRVSCIALTCCVAFAGNASARDTPSLAAISDLSEAGQSRVIDLRDEKSCMDGSLLHARCLPLGHFIDPTGKAIGFHALRWLLGTVGLTGEESVLLIGESEAAAQKVGVLLHRAGQQRVLMFDKPFRAQANASPGMSRSISRETVFTAPMRDDLYEKN